MALGIAIVVLLVGLVGYASLLQRRRSGAPRSPEDGRNDIYRIETYGVADLGRNRERRRSG